MSSKRETIVRDGVKYWVRRDEEAGQFIDWDRVSRSLPADTRQPAKRNVSPGQGDRGDQRRRKGKWIWIASANGPPVDVYLHFKYDPEARRQKERMVWHRLSGFGFPLASSRP
jgi:hypothetical protein